MGHIVNMIIVLQVVVPLLNWVAPSTSSSDVQEKQAGLVSQCLHMNNNNVGIILTPMHSYKRGSLWMLEHACQKALVQRNLSIDRTFGLQFKEKVDMRDKRPLLFAGRFALAAHVREHETPWRTSEFFAECLTKPATQLPSKNMRAVEDLAPEALPTTTDDKDTSGLCAAKKIAQIGEDAAQKLMEGLLTNVEFPERHGVIWVDMNPEVGDFLGGFIQVRSKTNTPMFYIAICKDEIHKEWFVKTWTDSIAKSIIEGKLKIPGFVAKAKDPPDSLMEAPPVKPVLNLMVWMADQVDKPGCPRGVSIPTSMIDKWYQHDDFGQQFRDFHDKVTAICGSPDLHSF
jgi:hypothetical protein